MPVGGAFDLEQCVELLHRLQRDRVDLPRVLAPALLARRALDVGELEELAPYVGRLDDAIADYDRAFAKNPDMPSSLFGRAVSWARKGERTELDSDADAAAKIDPDVSADFERYGVKL